MWVYIWNDTWLPNKDTIAYYPLNATTTVNDMSGNSKTLTNNNVTFWTYNWVDCANFSGSQSLYRSESLFIMLKNLVITPANLAIIFVCLLKKWNHFKCKPLKLLFSVDEKLLGCNRCVDPIPQLLDSTRMPVKWYDCAQVG